MSENPTIMNEIGLLNVRLNDLILQLNKTIQVLLEENKKLSQELAQHKTSTPPAAGVSAEPVKPAQG
ncbi:MAG: DIP1984 family protein [Candidatus Bathyarchaeota archaeon]|nr:DIP1984 family protein [Candidatus Termitimicrobium sp.]